MSLISARVIDSRYLDKMKHAFDGSVDKYKVGFVAGGLFYMREWTTKRPLLQLPSILPSELFCL